MLALQLPVSLAPVADALRVESDAPATAPDAVVSLDERGEVVPGLRREQPSRQELQLMTDLTSRTAGERRRIVEDYLDAVFGDAASAVADKLRMGIPELPDDPAPEQVAAWAELAALLGDPDFVASSRRMAQRALAEGPEPDPAQFQVGQAVGEIAGPAARAGVAPASPEALAVVERLEALGPQPPEARAAAAERIEAFTDRRVGRYWTLVGVINGWQPDQAPADVAGAWEWYGQALRAHA
jgi:hypothetical protein